MWIVDYLDEVESDLSAIHRVPYGTMGNLPCKQGLAMVERLFYYPGALRTLAEAESQDSNARGRDTTVSDPAVSAYFDIDEE